LTEPQEKSPEPEDSGTSGTQAPGKEEVIPAEASGDRGLRNLQIPEAVWDLVEQHPTRLGGVFAPFLASVFTDTFARSASDARQVEQLRNALDREKEECTKLRVSNARLEGQLDAEKGSRALRSGLISLGMIVFFAGFKLWDQLHLGAISVGLIVAGVGLVLIGWLHKPRGDSK